MRLNPHVTFDGQCEAAFKFYEKALGGKIAMMMTYQDSPLGEQMPANWSDKILHATFVWGGHVLQGADAPPGQYQKPQGFSVMLNIDEAAEADRIFHALAEKGEVQLPIQETFWARRFGMLVDQFGTPWTINCGKSA